MRRGGKGRAMKRRFTATTHPTTGAAKTRNAKTRNAKAGNAKTHNAKSRGAKTRATTNGVKASAMTSGRTATIAMLPGAVATANRMISSA
jgi:hypothetical protein